MNTKLEFVVRQASQNGKNTYMIIDNGDKNEYSVMKDSNVYFEYSDLITRLAIKYGNFFYLNPYRRGLYL